MVVCAKGEDLPVIAEHYRVVLPTCHGHDGLVGEVRDDAWRRDGVRLNLTNAELALVVTATCKERAIVFHN